MVTKTRYEILLLAPRITDILIRSGVISGRYSEAIEIYGMVKDYVEINNSSKNRAAEFIADLKGVSRRTVWNIIQEMETEIKWINN